MVFNLIFFSKFASRNEVLKLRFHRLKFSVNIRLIAHSYNGKEIV